MVVLVVLEAEAEPLVRLPPLATSLRLTEPVLTFWQFELLTVTCELSV